MGKSAPSAPDPTQVANAQTASNEQTAQYNQQLNMINSTGPNGSVTYNPSNAPGGYTQTTTLSPTQQGLYNSETSAEQGALNIANQQLGNVSSALGQTVTPGQLQYGASAGPIQTGYGQGGQIQTSIPQTVQGDQSVQNAAKAAYQQQTQYLQPQFSQQNEQLQAQLAAQGLNPNDAAYQNAVTLQNNQQNQAYQGAMNAAVSAGDQEQNTLYGQSLQSGQFANSAQAQQNQENAQAAQFGNSAQAQQYQQAYNNAGLNNQAQSQNFQQQAYNQELPINELSALLGLGQVSSPTGVNYTPAQAASTNVAGIDQNSYQDQLASDQAQNAGLNSAFGGLFSLGSAAINSYSDARLKTDIRRVGQLDSGLPIYAYRFKGSLRVEIGVLAQEVAMHVPAALSADPNGLLMVDYGMLS